VRAYWAIFSARFRTLLQYRAAAVAGVGTQLFWGLIRVMIFSAFSASSTATQPMTYPEVVTYIWLGQAMLLLILFRADGEVMALIRSGSVVYELARPVDLYWLWFCRAIAARTAPVLLRMGPVILVAALFFRLRAPASPLTGGLWLVSTISAVLLSAAIGTLLTTSMLWTVTGQGVNMLASSLMWFLSGIVVPLPLFPDWLQPALKVLPFRGLMDTPFRIYMGHIPPEQAVFAIAHQLAWTAAFIVLGRIVLRAGTRRLVVQGG